MASIRSVLLRLEVRPAGRLSHCTHNKKHEIKKGEPRFVVKPQGPAASEKGYCASCAAEMIRKGQADLVRLERDLSDLG